MPKFFSYLFFFISFFTFSQNDSDFGLVSYTFDINLYSYTEGYPYKARLYFNENSSLFIYNSINIEKTTGFSKTVGDRTGKVSGSIFIRNFDRYGNRFYLNFNTNELTSRELLADEFEVTVTEKNIDFDWKVTKESKKIGSYTCYKATTKNFGGRNYEVWFTYEIPIPTGPWKFHGLPGLILEVHDDRNLINITFNSIENPTKNKVNYFVPNSKEMHNLQSYLDENFKLYSAYVNNQRALNATGQLNRKITPLPYVNLEYTKEQQKLLNDYYQIEYKTFEAEKVKN